MAEQVAENNAAVEIARRRAIVESQAKQAGADKLHRMNVPDSGTKPRSPAITQDRMYFSNQVNNRWCVNAEMSHSIDDPLTPGYWAHMAQHLTPFDHIEVRSEDCSWMLELIVIQVERAWAKVALLHKYEFKMESLPGAEPAHIVDFKGPQHKWTVIRLSDRAVIRDGFKTKEEGEAWMREHERVIKA